MLLIGIVLVSHGPLAAGLKAAAEMIVGPQERFMVVGMDPSADLDMLRDEILVAVAQVSGASDAASSSGGADAPDSDRRWRPIRPDSGSALSFSGTDPGAREDPSSRGQPGHTAQSDPRSRR